MKLPELAIRNRTFTWFAVFLLVAAGISAFFSLGQLVDPAFMIKAAWVSTLYPGATPPRSSAMSPTDRDRRRS